MNDNTSIDEDFNLIMNEYRERQKLIKEKLILLYTQGKNATIFGPYWNARAQRHIWNFIFDLSPLYIFLKINKVYNDNL